MSDGDGVSAAPSDSTGASQASLVWFGNDSDDAFNEVQWKRPVQEAGKGNEEKDGQAGTHPAFGKF